MVAEEVGSAVASSLAESKWVKIHIGLRSIDSSSRGQVYSTVPNPKPQRRLGRIPSLP